MNKVELFQVMAENLGEEAYHESSPETVIKVRFKLDFIDAAESVGEGYILTVADKDIPDDPIGTMITIAGTPYYIRQPVDGYSGVTKYQVEKVA